MPETVGLLILTAAGATEAVTGIGSATLVLEVGSATISVASIVGTTALTAVSIAASIGLQYALNNPSVPKPEASSIPLKQAIPPRGRGFWICRLAGYYMLFLPAGGDSQDVLAMQNGRIEQVLQVYLHDIAVATVPDPADGVIVTVQQTGAGYFLTGAVQMQFFYGTETQNAGANGNVVNASNTGSTWGPAYAGTGIAAVAMYCVKATDPQQFTQVYPQGLPLPSALCKCTPVWDPRDPTQLRGNPLTWKASPNPVLQLIYYLTEPDGGMGEDLDDILPPAVLEQWMVEATLCDGRYGSAGFYQFDNAPENVIGKLLATCDGWFCEIGDTFTLTVGVYREPITPALTGEHILGFSVKGGMADEESVNQLDVTYTNPDAGYVSDQIPSVRNEDLISLAGIVRARPLDLSWVQDAGQAERLARRAMLRLNPAKSGSFVTTLYGMRYCGQRWVKLQFPAVKGLEDCVIEIQDKAKVDLAAGTVSFSWILVDPTALSAL